MSGRLCLWLPFTLAGGLAFIWFILLKILARLHARFHPHARPCPAALDWLVYNPLRRWYMRYITSGVA